METSLDLKFSIKIKPQKAVDTTKKFEGGPCQVNHGTMTKRGVSTLTGFLSSSSTSVTVPD